MVPQTHNCLPTQFQLQQQKLHLTKLFLYTSSENSFVCLLRLNCLHHCLGTTVLVQPLHKLQLCTPFHCVVTQHTQHTCVHLSTVLSLNTPVHTFPQCCHSVHLIHLCTPFPSVVTQYTFVHLSTVLSLNTRVHTFPQCCHSIHSICLCTPFHPVVTQYTQHTCVHLSTELSLNTLNTPVYTFPQCCHQIHSIHLCTPFHSVVTQYT